MRLEDGYDHEKHAEAGEHYWCGNPAPLDFDERLLYPYRAVF